jgi:ribonucleoside-diphosphate reductase beta chain
MENIHSEMYSILIDIKSKTRSSATDCSTQSRISVHRAEGGLVQEVNRQECRSRMVGRLLSAVPFASIYWIRKQCPLTFSNELISRDEALHTEFAVLMYSRLNTKLPDQNLRDYQGRGGD